MSAVEEYEYEPDTTEDDLDGDWDGILIDQQGQPAVDLAEIIARRLRNARLRVAKQEAWHRRMVERDNRWLEDTTARDRDLIAHCEGQLESFALAVIDHNPRGPKTIKLPSADVVTRAGSTAIEVANEEAAILWATGHDVPLIRWTEPKPAIAHIDKVAVKKAAFIERDGALYTTDGEQVPGIAIVHNPTTVTIDTGGEE